MKKEGFPGLGGKSESIGDKLKKAANAPDIRMMPHKNMNVREHMALQMYIGMLKASQWSYFNVGEVYGEERYAVDAVIGADALIHTLGKTPKQVMDRHEEISEYISEFEKDNEEEESEEEKTDDEEEA